MNECETREFMEDVAAVVRAYVSELLSPISDRMDGFATTLGNTVDLAAKRDAKAVADLTDELRREYSREREVFAAEMRALRAEWETRLAGVAEAERRLTERVATLKDGEPGRDGVNGADGASVTIDDVLPALLERATGAVSESVERIVPGLEAKIIELVAAIPVPRDGLDGADGRAGVDGQDGKDADPEVMRAMVLEAVAAIPAPADGKDGRDGIDGRDGKDVDMDAVRAFVTEAVSEIPVPKDGLDGVNGKDGINGRDGADGRDGKDADPEHTAALVREAVATAVAAIPAAKDGEPGKDGLNGKDGDGVEDITVVQNGAMLEIGFTVGDTRSVFEIELPAGPEGVPGRDGADGVNGRDGLDGKDGADGKLPEVKTWADGVYYAGDVVTFEGATWQALRDTGRTPTTADWVCIAARGVDGRDGRSLKILGTWSAEETYGELDVVTLNGGAFVARCDDPGPCPGAGWQLMAAQGKRGAPGERGVGERGEPGRAGPPVVAASINDQGLLTLVNGDGSTVECDFYPVLAKIDR